MFSRLKAWLLQLRDKRQLLAKIIRHSKQDSLIYPWLDDQKN